MTELVMGWAKGIWGREALRRKIERLDNLLPRLRAMLKKMAEANQSAAEANRVQGAEVMRLETENKALLDSLKAYEDAERFVDPDAKCPFCGARDGFLVHIPAFDPHTKACIDVVVQNNCNVCKGKFQSAEPVAGRDLAAQLYQPDVAVKK